MFLFVRQILFFFFRIFDFVNYFAGFIYKGERRNRRRKEKNRKQTMGSDELEEFSICEQSIRVRLVKQMKYDEGNLIYYMWILLLRTWFHTCLTDLSCAHQTCSFLPFFPSRRISSNWEKKKKQWKLLKWKIETPIKAIHKHNETHRYGKENMRFFY